jgi:hypothetical protein
MIMRLFMIALLLLPVMASARDYPASSGYFVNGVCSGYSGEEAACSAFGGAWFTHPNSGITGCWHGGTEGQYPSGYWGSPGVCKFCPDGGTLNAAGMCIAAPECEEGEIVNDKGACSPDCESVKGQSFGVYADVISGTCILGCRVTTSSSQCGYTDEGVLTSCEYHGPFTITGESCEADNPSNCNTVEFCDDSGVCKQREVCESDGNDKNCGVVKICTGEGENEECHEKTVCDEDNNKDCTKAQVCTGEGENETCKEVEVCNEGDEGDKPKDGDKECKEGEDCEDENKEGENCKEDDEDCKNGNGGVGDFKIPGVEDFEKAFFKDTFDDILSWRLPSCNGNCKPVNLEILFFKRTYVMETHCNIASDVLPYFRVVMMFVWSILALFIVLRA